jgi:hypothetical protein
VVLEEIEEMEENEVKGYTKGCLIYGRSFRKVVSTTKGAS